MNRNIYVKSARAFLAVTLLLTWACTDREKSQLTVNAGAPPTNTTTEPVGAGGPTRIEKDLLGEKAVPSGAYWGVQTQRALENFQISGVPINRYPEFRTSVGDCEIGGGARKH